MRIFVDMDGTLAKWNNVEFEQLFEKGYYRNLEPNKDILQDINILILEEKDVYILSCVLPESKYALEEKKEWLKKYVPNLPEEKYIFVPYGRNKADYLKEYYSPITSNDYLIDDYTKNLIEWKEYGGMGVKYINGINHTRGTWNGLMIHEENGLETYGQSTSLITLILLESLRHQDITCIAGYNNLDLLENGYYDGVFEEPYYGESTDFSDYMSFLCLSDKKPIFIEWLPLAYETLIKTENNIMIELRKGQMKKELSPIKLSELNYEKLKKQYYCRLYPTLSKCKDFDKLINNLGSGTLDYMEHTLYLWEYTDKINTNRNFELSSEYNINTSFILWYEGTIDTEDLMENIQCESNQELDEPDICD